MDILYELIAKKLQPGYSVNVIKDGDCGEQAIKKPVRFPDRLFSSASTINRCQNRPDLRSAVLPG